MVHKNMEKVSENRLLSKEAPIKRVKNEWPKIVIFGLIGVMVVVGLIIGVKALKGNESDRNRKNMGEQLSVLQLNNIDFKFPMEMSELTDMGYSIDKSEPTTFYIDTIVCENMYDLFYNYICVGSVVLDENERVVALKTAVGTDWKSGEIGTGTAWEDLELLYGEPDKRYVGVYSGGIYNTGDYSIYFNDTRVTGTPTLSMVLYIMNDNMVLYDSNVSDDTVDVKNKLNVATDTSILYVTGKEISLCTDIYEMTSELEKEGYTLSERSTEGLVVWNILDKHEEVVGSLVYDGKVTGSYSIGFEGNEVSICGISKGMTYEELTAVLGEPKYLADGALAYDIGLIYKSRKLQLIVDFDIENKVNYISCNITDTDHRSSLLPNGVSISEDGVYYDENASDIFDEQLSTETVPIYGE